ncbi:hypothetical protein IFM89_004121 [Coptis chinensis]|uniref:Uncharacterized protein n=1 Tax=Coptis chinensis TaxID=261450 RepID=A0A835H4H6_9MAGN|nr:hypothetical protein IFM89_004121 [Coptis chinensis]
MDPKTQKLVRITTIVSTLTVSYFLLTADYGPEPNILDPIKKKIESAESSVKKFVFGYDKESQESESGKTK